MAPEKVTSFPRYYRSLPLGGRNLATEILSRGGLHPKDLNFRGVTEELLVPNHATVNVEKEERSKTFGTYLLAFSVCHFISMFF